MTLLLFINTNIPQNGLFVDDKLNTKIITQRASTGKHKRSKLTARKGSYQKVEKDLRSHHRFL